MNTSLPKVSVIVAVYNAEAYIDRCMRSLLCQTLKEIEVILVDDGSTDRSGEICDSYAAKDARVKVIHKQNEGVALTRQRGIDSMTGEYSIHVDPDDWIEPDMLEIMYDKAKSENLDIVVCGIIMEFHDRSTEYPQQFSYLDRDGLINSLLHFRLSPNILNKLIRSRIYKDLNIIIPPRLSWGEDMIVCLRVLMSGNKISFIDKCLYHYDRYSNSNSLTSRFDNYRHFKEFIECYPEMRVNFHGKDEIRALNYYVTDIAHKTFYYGDISSIDGIRIFLRYIFIFLNSAHPLRRKLNLIAASIGLAPIVKPIYKRLKKLHGKSNS